jgi:hypothetical protein
MLVVHVELGTEDDVDELNRWYEEEHRPDKMKLPGYTSMRRFRAHDGQPHFLAIYELEYPEAAEPSPETRMPATDWSKAVLAKWKNWNRRIWVELPGPDYGG